MIILRTKIVRTTPSAQITPDLNILDIFSIYILSDTFGIMPSAVPNKNQWQKHRRNSISEQKLLLQAK